MSSLILLCDENQLLFLELVLFFTKVSFVISIFAFSCHLLFFMLLHGLTIFEVFHLVISLSL